MPALVRTSAALVLVMSISGVRAELHRGDGYVLMGDGGGWDFSDSAYVTGPALLNADVFLRVMASFMDVDRSPTQECLGAATPAGLQYAPFDADFDSLRIAPGDGYVDAVWAYQGRCYFVRTRELHFAKIQLLLFDGYHWPFRYVYQDDGSTTLPITPTTWGRIKTLFSTDQ